MDTLIAEYLQDTYHPELAASIIRSFELLEQFNITEHELPILNLVATQANRDSAEIHDGVLRVLRDELVRAMAAHHIVLQDDTRIDQYNEWLEGLSIFQDLENYSDLARWLESDMSPEDKLLEVMRELTALTVSELQDLLVSFEPTLVDDMLAYVTFQDEKRQIADTVSDEDTSALLATLKLFQTYISPHKAVGVSLAAAGVLPGRPLTLYKSLLKLPWDTADTSALARDIYSVILLSDAHRLSPTAVYREHSRLFLKDVATVQRVDVELLKLSLAFTDYCKQSTADKGDDHVKRVV
jgi:hypothetical protein